MAFFTIKTVPPTYNSSFSESGFNNVNRNYMGKALRNLGLLVAAIVLSFNTAMAVTYYTAAGTGQDFAVLATWWTGSGGTGTHPASFLTTDVYTVSNNATVSLLGANVTVGSIVVNSGSTLTIPASNAFTLTANTTISNAGTINVTGGTLKSTTSTSST